MAKKLWLKSADIPELTSFSGNIDADSLLPHIHTSQRTEMKRILGLDLYNYIDTRIQDGTPLAGEYEKIFDEYAIDMLVYFSAMNYMAFGGYKIANAGVFKQTAEGATTVDVKEVNIIIERYRALAASVEMDFYKYMEGVNIPEYAKNGEPGGSINSTWF